MLALLHNGVNFTMKAIKIRYPSDIGALEYFTLLGVLVWIRLPAAFSLSDNPFARIVALLPLIIVITKVWAQKLLNQDYYLIVKKSLLYPFLLYVLILFASFVQAALYNSVSIEQVIGNSLIPFLVLFFGASIASEVKSAKSLQALQCGIFMAVVIYLALNFVFYASGIRFRTEIFVEPRPSLLLSYLGLVLPRITFPMASGINSYGYTAGMVLTAGIVIMRSLKRRTLGLFSILLALVTMVLVDSRAALLFSLLASALVARKNLVKKHSWLIIFLSLTLPLLALFILQNLPLEWVSLLSRSETDAITLSNRTVIWDAGLHDFSTFKVQNVIGWGYRGQIPSGIMDKYAFLFSNYQNIVSISLHNAYLQHLVDTGYLGLGIFLFLLNRLLQAMFEKRFAQQSPWGLVLGSMAVYLIVSSSMDSVLLLDFQETFSIFLLILTSTIFARRRF
jgi:O-antigen ligase